MTPTNGAVPAEYLAPLAGSSLMAEKNTAAAYGRLRAAHPEVHLNGAAAAYWTRAMDIDIHAHPTSYNISASEAKKLSAVGNSPHGLGLRLNFSGVTPAVAAQFGFSEFNAYTFTYTGTPSWDQATIPSGSRRVVAAGAHVRAAPTLDAPILSTDAPGSVIAMQGYVWASPDRDPSKPVDTVNGSSAWYVDGNGHFIHSTGVEGASSAGVPDITLVLYPPPPKPAVPSPTAPPVAVVPTTPPTVPLPVEAAPTTATTTTTNTPPKASLTVSAKTLADQVAARKAASDALQADNARIAAALVDAGQTPVLAGLLSGKTATRKRLYVAYAIAGLVISCASDVVTYGLLSAHASAELVIISGLTTSILLKVGSAFGLVAASNTK